MSVLVDIASYVPAGRLDNLPNCERFAIQPQFLDEKIGTREVARMGEGEDAATMGAEAVRRLFAKTGLAAGDVSCLVVCTQNPAGGGIPHTSARIHGELGLGDGAACFDVSLGCSGYVYGLSILGGFLEANGLDSGVLVTSDPYSPTLDKDDKNTTLLFGDGATASLVRREGKGWKLGRFLFATRGSKGAAICNDGDSLEMKGREVFEFCLREVPLQIRVLLQGAGVMKDDVDAFVLHQGSKFIVDQVSKVLGLPEEKVPQYLRGVGNTVSSSIPLVLEQKVLGGGARRVVLSGFGVGLSWASGIIEFNN